MSLHGFDFASPDYLFALIGVALLLAGGVLVRRRRSRYAVSFSNLEVLGSVAATRSSHWQRHLPIALLALALVLMTAALARPRIALSSDDRGTTVVLLADVSGSMAATDVYPSRIAAAVYAMETLVRELPKRDRVGLVTFSDQAETVDEPTTDHADVLRSLSLLHPEGGTALGAGVETAVGAVVSSLAANGVQHVPGEDLPAAIVLESDGAQNRGDIAPLEAADLAKTAGIRIFGVALGTRRGYILQGKGILQLRIGVPPDPGTVALLARETGGYAYQATDEQKLNTVYRSLGSSVAHRTVPTDIASWFDLAAAAALIAGVWLARSRGGVLP